MGSESMDNRESSEDPNKPGPSARVPLSGIILLSVVVAIASSVLVLAVQGRNNLRPQRASQVKSYLSNSGPWGQLECMEIIVQMGDESITDLFLVDRPAQWVFEDYNFDRLANLFQGAGIAYEDFAPLLETARPTATGEGYVLSPSDDFIMKLSPSARASIYNVLAENAENLRQNEPFRFPVKLADSWLDDSALAESTMDMIRKLVYRRGEVMIFADIDVALRRLPDRGEKMRLIKTLARTPALVIKLLIEPDQDVEPLVHYWGVNGRETDIRPLFESLARNPSGGEIGMALLLPPFAQKRLYTYPLRQGWEKQTCYWTALNFYNEEPDDRFAGQSPEELEVVGREVLTNYDKIARKDLKFGDMILLMKSNETAIHACVYVADDIVFTKNGPGRSSPWILMKLGDVLSIYREADSKVDCFRKKQPS